MPPSVASSYTTAPVNGDGEPSVLPARTMKPSLVDKMPKSRSSREEAHLVPVDDVRGFGRRPGIRRERSTSRDKKERLRSRESGERPDKKERRDRKDKARKDSRANKQGDRAGGKEDTRRGPAQFSSQIGSAGFIQFPGQYDTSIPGQGAISSEHHASMSPHVQDQFPGQFPAGTSAPYRPPLASGEGGPGLAAEYYGDAGESVAHQPGFRKHSPSLIIGAEPHLQPASSIVAPPPEPSASGGVGAAASFFSGEFDDSVPTIAEQNPSNYTQASSRPDTSHTLSLNTIPTAGSVALGGAANYVMSGAISGGLLSHQGKPGYNPTLNGAPSDSSVVTTAGPSSQPQAAYYSSSTRPPKPGKNPFNSSTIPQYAAGGAGAAALAGAVHSHSQQSFHHGSTVQQYPATTMKYRHRSHGPLSAIVEFFRDPDGVAQFEEYSEIIGVCRGCFEPGSSPRDAPRKHRFYKRRSKDRYSDSARVDKQNRYPPSEDEVRRKKDSSWLGTGLGAGLAGYGLGKVGETIFNQRNDFGDTDDVKSGRFSPGPRNRVSRKSSNKLRRRSRSNEWKKMGVTRNGKIYQKDSRSGVFGDPTTAVYAARSSSKSRSESRDAKTTPTSAAVGVSATAYGIRRRSRSPRKAFVKEKHHAPGRHRQYKKKKENGFFSFLSPSSSSSNLGMASQSDKEKRGKDRRSSDRIENNREAKAALFGLGAATAALALKDGRSSKKSKKNLMAVKESKEISHRRPRESEYSYASSEEAWVSATEGEFNHVDSDLAFGSPSRRSSYESLSSQASGTDKWNWRWGRAKKSKGSPTRLSGSSSLPIAAETAGAALAGPAHMSYDQSYSPAMDSTNNLPLQRVYPIPTSDPGRFDVQREGSVATPSQPVLVSRPENASLQQPQPIAPVSSSFYASQTQNSRLNRGSAESPVLSQPSYPEVAPMTSTPDASPRYDRIRDETLGGFKLLRRGTSPARFGEDPISNSLSPQHRPAAKDDASAVRFALSEEQEEKHRRERRRKRKEEKEEEERMEFKQISSEDKPGKKGTPAEDRHAKNSEQNIDASWMTPAVGIASVVIGTAAASEKSKRDESREERRERRRRERAREDEEDAMRREERQRIGEREDERERDYRLETAEIDITVGRPDEFHDNVSPSGKMSVQEQAGSKVFSHENSQSFFTPVEILNKSDDQDKVTDTNPEADIDHDRSAAIVEITPKNSASRSHEPEWSVADTNEEIDLSKIALPWKVPRLKLIQPTPPASRASTPFFETDGASQKDEQPLTEARSPSKVAWGEDQIHECTEVTPIEYQEELIKFVGTNRGRTRDYSDSESDDHVRQQSNEIKTSYTDGSSSKSLPCYGNDYEFAATLAASAQDAGFDPSIVIDDPTYRRRNSPPGSIERSMPGAFDNDDDSTLDKKHKKHEETFKSPEQSAHPGERNDNAIVEDIVSQVEQFKSLIGETGEVENCDVQSAKQIGNDSTSEGSHVSVSEALCEEGAFYNTPMGEATCENGQAVDGEESRETLKKSKKQRSDFGETAPAIFAIASVKSSGDTNLKARSSSALDRVRENSTDELTQSNGSRDAQEQAILDEPEKLKKRGKASKPRKSKRESGDDYVGVPSKASRSSDKEKRRRSKAHDEGEVSGRITQDLPAEVYPSTVLVQSF